MSSPAEEFPCRRKFFVNGLKASIAIFGVSITVPLLGFFISPILNKSEKKWIAVTDLSKVKNGEPSKITYKHRRKDGWMTSEAHRTVFILFSGQELTVWSNRCTHLGCAVNWSSSSNQFTCPCHGGVFDAQGNAVAGPPPAPLAKLPCKIENGVIFIKEA
jgi:Rieske Fe-S protein